MKIIITICCTIYYITSAIEIIPSIIKILKIKSSNDYSLISTWLGIISCTAWSIYIYLTDQTSLVYLGTFSDLVLVYIQAFSIFKFYKK